jgi:hypothetical protein
MTPDAVKYRITLENEQRLRTHTWQPDDDLNDDVPTSALAWSHAAFTPTSRLLVWMLHPSHKSWATPVAVMLAPVYIAVAFALWHWTPSSGAIALLATLGVAVALWNAVKFAIAAVVAAWPIRSGRGSPISPSRRRRR